MANEVRLIDANALMDSFRRYIAERHDRERCVSEENCNTCERECLWRRVVKNAPTVDAVEVVRCKDCKHWKCWRSSGEGTGDCNLDEGYQTLATQHYDYCSYGERKDNERKAD